jgi:nucleoside-diphosphate-sugar epimerase
MEWHVHGFGGKALLAKGPAPLIGPGTGQRDVVAAADVAQVAVLALSAAAAPRPVIEIGGPGHFGHREPTAV